MVGIETTPRAAHSTIAEWYATVLEGSDRAAVNSLRDMYGAGAPGCTGFIVTGACEFRCNHCIYGDGYERFNRGMPVDDWNRILRAIDGELKTPTYFYGGRAVTDDGVAVLTALREVAPAATIGLVDNGISIVRHLSALQKARLDWLDLSFDGTREAHDRQRGRAGSFEAALAGAKQVRSQRVAPKVSVLTCVTRYNAADVVPMIRLLHGHGQRNFFLIPVVVVEGQRPDAQLRVPAADLARIANDCWTQLTALDDTYVELAIFEPEDLLEVAAGTATEHLRVAENHVFAERTVGNSSFCMRYWPASLDGMREFIVNPDGRVILPKSMAWGSVPAGRVIGNLLEEGPRETWRRLPDSPAFEEFACELRRERQVLGKSLGRLLRMEE